MAIIVYRNKLNILCFSFFYHAFQEQINLLTCTRIYFFHESSF